jgi:hypothetical protein
MSDSDDKKTDRDKLFAEQRAIKDTIRGPSNLQVRRQGHGMAYQLLGCGFWSPAAAFCMRQTQQQQRVLGNAGVLVSLLKWCLLQNAVST